MSPEGNANEIFHSRETLFFFFVSPFASEGKQTEFTIADGIVKVRYISDQRILNIPKRTHLRPKPSSFGSMLSLVTTTGAVEVHWLGC